MASISKTNLILSLCYFIVRVNLRDIPLQRGKRDLIYFATTLSPNIIKFPKSFIFSVSPIKFEVKICIIDEIITLFHKYIEHLLYGTRCLQLILHLISGFPIIPTFYVLKIRPAWQCFTWTLVRSLDFVSVWMTKTQYLLVHFFYLTFKYDQAHAFPWTTQFQSV